MLILIGPIIALFLATFRDSILASSLVDLIESLICNFLLVVTMQLLKQIVDIVSCDFLWHSFTWGGGHNHFTTYLLGSLALVPPTSLNSGLLIIIRHPD